MPNLSSVVNYFATPNEGFATTLGSTISSGAVTVPLAGTSGLTNGSIFVGIIEPGATNQQVFTGIVDTGGSQITSVVWTRGTNNSHVGGVSIVDYVTGTAFGMLSKGILVEHNQSGTHGAITSTGATLTTPTIITPTIKGTVDGWIGANESWVYASATTITVPTDATTKYDVGDYIKFTQSSTVKYFMITSLTSTVLTVAGLGGATVANAAISLNSYSKTHHAHGLGVSAGAVWQYLNSANHTSGTVTSSGATPTLVTDLSVLVTIPTGCTAVKITVQLQNLYLQTGDGLANMYIYSGATVGALTTQVAGANCNAGSGSVNFGVVFAPLTMVIKNPTAGAIYYSAAISATASNAKTDSSSTASALILVEAC